MSGVERSSREVVEQIVLLCHQGRANEAEALVAAGDLKQRLLGRLRGEQIDESQSPENGEHFESWRSGYLTAIDMVTGWVAALATASQPDKRVDGWQPIETAPKDGTRILLWTDTRAGDAALRQYVEVIGSDAHFAQAQIGRWEDWQDGQWTTENIGEATHWMPLPALPTTSNERDSRHG